MCLHVARAHIAPPWGRKPVLGQSEARPAALHATPRHATQAPPFELGTEGALEVEEEAGQQGPRQAQRRTR